MSSITAIGIAVHGECGGGRRRLRKLRDKSSRVYFTYSSEMPYAAKVDGPADHMSLIVHVHLDTCFRVVDGDTTLKPRDAGLHGATWLHRCTFSG
jgi:hypothetical protein